MVHCTVRGALEVAGLAPAAEVVLVAKVWVVPALEAVAEVDLPAAVPEAALLDVVEVVAFDAPVFDVEVEVFVPAVVLAVPVLLVLVLAVVAEVFWVGAGVVGFCGESVCASRTAPETKLQIRMMIERFMVRPFKDSEPGKLPKTTEVIQAVASGLRSRVESKGRPARIGTGICSPALALQQVWYLDGGSTVAPIPQMRPTPPAACAFSHHGGHDGRQFTH